MSTVPDQEQQPRVTNKSSLDKAVIRLSSRRTLFQIISTIPTFAVELTYGIKYLNQCPIQPLINVFLIVHACASLAEGIVLFIGFIAAKHIKKSLNTSSFTRILVAGSSIGQLILLFFSIVWLIVGQVWVFGAFSNGFQSTDSTQSSTYCHQTVFWTGFAIIVVTYAICLILILVLGGRFLIKRHKMKRQTVVPNNQ
ncbi:unnamed protein product [Adineta steineri]|uniref:Uncharacterized protein n=1 Tax=Adineta steineri TaxID=433720 RepID=A0A815EAM6_9BILA|nr:unnamed protein product [Adineta steineri]CAF1307480.1 unnamed protein product [Adineta steineri]CAF1308569.1 unnamed protein product [Adineta steineri]